MANVDKPRGFQLWESGGKNLRVRSYTKGGEAIYKGDLVNLNASGVVVPYDKGDNLVLGVAAEYQAAASTSILVIDDPDALFLAQCDGDFQLVDVGQNADVLATDGSNGLSAHEIESTTFATTAALPVKLLGLSAREGNVTGTNAVVICKINNHTLGSGTGATGI